MLCSPSHHGRCRYHCPKLCTFQISFCFYFVALIPVLQRKSVINEDAPGKKREVSSFPGHIYWGENVQRRVTRGISFLLEEGRLSPDTGSPDTQTRRHGRCQPPSSSAQVQLLRSVSVRGRSVTSAVSFFFSPLLITIIIIIIIIIIFIIITNTVSHLSIPENKLIHSLSCDANLVGLTCIAFSPSPLLCSLTHSFIHSFVHSWNQRFVAPNTHWPKLVSFH